jgi:hypothetical protein
VIGANPVVHIEALGVAAVGPRHDVRGAKQRRLANASERAAAAPVIHQGFAENILTDPLDYQPLGLRRSRQAGGLYLESGERRVRQADGELVDAIKRGVQLREGGEHESR